MRFEQSCHKVLSSERRKLALRRLRPPSLSGPPATPLESSYGFCRPYRRVLLIGVFSSGLLVFHQSAPCLYFVATPCMLTHCLVPFPRVASHKSAVRQEYPIRLWYCVACGITLFILANLWSKLRRCSRSNALLRRPPSFPRNIYTGPISWRRLPAAIGTAWNIAAYRWTIPYGRNHVLSLTELCATTGYAAAVLTWSFVNCQLHPLRDIQTGIYADYLLIQPMADRKSSGLSVQALLPLRKYHFSHSLLERITFSAVSYLVVS